MIGHRFSALLLAASMGLGGVASAHAAQGDPSAVEETVAVVRVALRHADGSVMRAPARAVRLGDTVAFELSSDAHAHHVDVTVDDDGSVDLAYATDGVEVPADRATKTRRAVVFHTRDGVEIALSVLRTKVRVEAHPG